MCLSVVLAVVVMGVSGFSPVANCMVVRFRWLICTRWTQAVPVLKVMLLPFQGAACGVNAVTQGVASLALGYGLDGLSARLPCVFSRALGAFFVFCCVPVCSLRVFSRVLGALRVFRRVLACFPCVVSREMGASFAFFRVSGRFLFVLFCVLGFVGRFAYRLNRGVRRSALKGQKHCSAKQSSPVQRHFSQAVRAAPGGCVETGKPERFCTFSRALGQTNFYEFLTANLSPAAGGNDFFGTEGGFPATGIGSGATGILGVFPECTSRRGYMYI